MDLEEIVAESSGEGNTQDTSPQDVKKRQVPARRHHFFTYNNYSSSDINILREVFNEKCYMYVFQEEMGKSGTPHLQGVCSCKAPIRDTAFGFKKIHWEKVIDVKHAYKYCSMIYEEDGRRKRVGEIWAKKYNYPQEFKIKNYRDWMKNLDAKLVNEPDDRKILWYWSEEGNVGKSVFTKHLVVNKGATFLSKGKYSDIINVIYKSDIGKIVVIDLPRNNGNKVSYDALEAIKNGLICNTKFETGFKMFEAPHIVVFANEYPETEKLSEDRWDIYKIES